MGMLEEMVGGAIRERERERESLVGIVVCRDEKGGDRVSLSDLLENGRKQLT